MGCASCSTPLRRTRTWVVAVLTAVSLAGCSGTDPLSELPFDLGSGDNLVSEASRLAGQGLGVINELASKGLPGDIDMAEAVAAADQVVSSVANQLGTSPEAFASMTPEQIASLVAQAQQASAHAIQVTQDQIAAMTPEQQALIAQAAMATANGLLDQTITKVQTRIHPTAMDTAPEQQPVVRVGVNALGGYAATSAYLWTYLLRESGYAPTVQVGTGAELAQWLNSNQIDVAFEAVPEFVAPGTLVLGTWSEGRLNVQGRVSLAAEQPILADSLTKLALSRPEMVSLASLVATRGVSDPITQEAAVQLWLIGNPAVVERLAAP